METFAGLGVFAVLFLFVLAILWTCLPFAVFGIKPRLDKLHGEQRAANDLLRQLIGELQVARGYQVSAAPIEQQPPESPPDIEPAQATPSAPPSPIQAAAPAAKPYDERAEKIARARELAAKVRRSSPGENRME